MVIISWLCTETEPPRNQSKLKTWFVYKQKVLEFSATRTQKLYSKDGFSNLQSFRDKPQAPFSK